jgi:hypothetical protein
MGESQRKYHIFRRKGTGALLLEVGLILLDRDQLLDPDESSSVQSKLAHSARQPTRVGLDLVVSLGFLLVHQYRHFSPQPITHNP